MYLCKKHNYVPWSIYWSKCKNCGKLESTEDVEETTTSNKTVVNTDIFKDEEE